MYLDSSLLTIWRLKLPVVDKNWANTEACVMQENLSVIAAALLGWRISDMKGSVKPGRCSSKWADHLNESPLPTWIMRIGCFSLWWHSNLAHPHQCVWCTVCLFAESQGMLIKLSFHLLASSTFKEALRQYFNTSLLFIFGEMMGDTLSHQLVHSSRSWRQFSSLFQ